VGQQRRQGDAEQRGNNRDQAAGGELPAGAEPAARAAMLGEERDGAAELAGGAATAELSGFTLLSTPLTSAQVIAIRPVELHAKQLVTKEGAQHRLCPFGVRRLGTSRSLRPPAKCRFDNFVQLWFR